MPAQQPIQDESDTSVAQQTESSNRPRLTKKERATGLIVDIADIFHDGPIKQAVSLPSFRTSFIALPVIFILTVSAMISGIMTGGHFFQTKKLEHFGAAAQAVVINKESVQKGDKKTRTGKLLYIIYDYWIVYRFQVLSLVREGRFFSKREQVSKELHDQLKVDTPVSVFYDRKNPAVSRIKENYVIFSPLDGEVSLLFSCKGIAGLYLDFLILIFGGTAVVGILLWIIKGIIASALLYIKGKLATAEIIELEEFYGNRSKEYAIVYRFKPSEASAVITGRQNISKDIYSVYSQEETVDVMYLAKKPEWFKAKLYPNIGLNGNR